MIKISDISTIAAARGEKVAIVAPEETITWQGLESRVRRWMVALAGLDADARIQQAVYLADNRVELVAALAGFSSLGIPVAGVDYTLAPDVVLRAAAAINADFFVIASVTLGDQRTRRLIDTLPGRVVDLDSAAEGTIALADLLPTAETVPAAGEVSVTARPFRAVVFTSGTSGDPKPVVRHRSADARRFAYFTQRYGFNSQDRYLLTIPLYHVAGSGWARNFLGVGATLYLAPVIDATALARVVESQRITATVTTPITLARLIDTLDLARHALRFVLVGGKNFSPTQKKAALDALGPVVYEYYGSSETGVNTIAEPQDLAQFPDSVGRPYSGNRVLVVDDTGRTLPPGAPGRIVASGYLGMDHYAIGETPSLQIGGERFLVTPDRGYLDPEGRLYVFNRSSGQDGNFDVYAVEETLRRHIDLHDVAIALDSPAGGGRQRSGDVALVLAADSGDATRIAAVASARVVLRQAGIQDRRVDVVDAIPYNLSGKVRWIALADLLAGQQADSAPQRRAA